MFLPWCETAARRQRLQPTIGLCNVASEGQHRPINKESVGLIRPIQCRVERRSQRPHSRVVDSAAWLIAKIDNGGRVGCIRDSIQRLMWDIEMDGMERFIQQKSRISLQIIKCGPAGPNSESRKLATFFPIFLIGKVAKLKRDEEGILARDAMGHGMRRVIRAYLREADNILAQGT